MKRFLYKYKFELLALFLLICFDIGYIFYKSYTENNFIKIEKCSEKELACNKSCIYFSNEEEFLNSVEYSERKAFVYTRYCN